MAELERSAGVFGAGSCLTGRARRWEAEIGGGDGFLATFAGLGSGPGE